MKCLKDGTQVQILKQYQNQSVNFNDKLNRYHDLLKVKYINGNVGIICTSELI